MMGRLLAVVNIYSNDIIKLLKLLLYRNSNFLSFCEIKCSTVVINLSDESEITFPTHLQCIALRPLLNYPQILYIYHG